MELQGTTFRLVSQLLYLLLVVELACASDNVTPLVGSIGESITLKCDLEVADPVSLQWRDTVYSMDRNPVTIFCTMSGQVHEDHYNHASYEISASNPTELTINDLKDSDVGSYFCVSTLADDTVLTQEFTLGLAGGIECEGDADDLMVGDTVDASCKVPFTSSVKPEFKWWIGEDDLQGTKDKTQFGELWIEHSLEATKEMDQQKLTCKLSFHGFELECSIPLSVKHAPYVKMFEDSTGEDEKKHSFSCTVSANPAPQINIMKVNDDGTSSSLDPERTSVTTKGNTATVTFKKLMKEDAGKYVCEASNDNGEVSSEASLGVEKSSPSTGDKNPAGGDNSSARMLTASLVLFAISTLLHLL